MSGIVNTFGEFKRTSKINNVIIDWSRKNNEINNYMFIVLKKISISLMKKIDF